MSAVLTGDPFFENQLRMAIAAMKARGARLDIAKARKVFADRRAAGSTVALSLVAAIAVSQMPARAAETSDVDPLADLPVANSLEDLLDFGELCLASLLYGETDHDHGFGAFGSHAGRLSHETFARDTFVSSLANPFANRHDGHEAGGHHAAHESDHGGAHHDHALDFSNGHHGDAHSGHANHGGDHHMHGAGAHGHEDGLHEQHANAAGHEEHEGHDDAGHGGDHHSENHQGSHAAHQHHETPGHQHANHETMIQDAKAHSEMAHDAMGAMAHASDAGAYQGDLGLLQNDEAAHGHHADDASHDIDLALAMSEMTMADDMPAPLPVI